MRRDPAPRSMLPGLAAMVGLSVAAFLAVTSGCPGKSPPPVTETPAGDSSAGDDSSEGAGADADDAPVPQGACGRRGLRMEDFGWLPADARVVIRFDLDNPQTPQALRHLAERARGEDHGLPITLAFGATQWPIFVPVLGSLLDEIGLTPAELVYVQLGGETGFAWVVPHQCDVDQAIARVEAQWGLSARRDVDAVVLHDPRATRPARPAQDDLRVVSPKKDDPEAPPPFPYDLLLLEGGRAAMVPAGQGEAVLRGLSGKRDAVGLGGSAPAWDDVLGGIEAAPLRGIVRGRALMGTGSRRSEPSVLRVTADAVTLEPLVAGEK